MAQRFPIMSDKERTQSAIQEEHQAFAQLLKERKFTRELIGRPDTLLASEQIPREGFDRLHLAAQISSCSEYHQKSCTTRHRTGALIYEETQ